MNATIDTSSTVGELVAQNPARARVFEKVGIDYCCGGKKPFEDACREKGLDAQAVASQLDLPGEASASRFADARSMTLTELADHIVATHHAYLRNELPRIDHLVGRVTNAHGQKHPEVLQVAAIFASLAEEMNSHMAKEERILFPAIRNLDATGDAQFHCGTLSGPIGVMEAEHDSAGDALAQFRELTRDYSTPPDVCNTYRALMDALRDLEEDMHQHVHKENNVLFPRALAMEAGK